LITPDNLQKMGDEIRFISRLPVTYHAHGQVIEQVLAANAWEAVGRLAETAPSKNRPGAEYRVVEASVSLEGRDYHAIVVHSSSHDRRQHKRLERDLQRSERHLQGQLKTLCRGTYACERRRRPTRRVRSTHPTIDCESRSKRGPAMRRGAAEAGWLPHAPAAGLWFAR
jgi:hypothetical protein